METKNMEATEEAQETGSEEKSKIKRDGFNGDGYVALAMLTRSSGQLFGPDPRGSCN